MDGEEKGEGGGALTAIRAPLPFSRIPPKRSRPNPLSGQTEPDSKRVTKEGGKLRKKPFPHLSEYLTI